MSRIGRLPIPVPGGVDVSIDGQTVAVKGPRGTLTHTVATPINTKFMRRSFISWRFRFVDYHLI